MDVSPNLLENSFIIIRITNNRGGVVKHHDSIKQADKKLALAIKQLQLWHLAATPINYAISYEFINGKNAPLNMALKQQLAANKKLDNFFMEELYQQFILGQSSFRDEIITDIDELIDDVQHSNKKSVHSANNFIKQVDTNLANVQSNDQKKINLALNQIKAASKSFKLQQQELAKRLLATKQQSLSLKNELAEVKKEIYLDPLTGLYNRKALNKHLDTWIGQDPNKQVSAIVINIDKFHMVNQNFGSLISDVLLSKIANKINSYVGESGLPVRSGSDEFLILLPEVERPVASEIAEKIRQGVEKLRFVSSKSGVRLPQMTISMGVNDFRLSQNVHSIINYTRSLVNDMQLSNNNKITVAN